MAQTFLDDRQVVNRAALAAIGSATNATLDSVFGDINTLFANATSAATASVIMKRDANANTQVNNLIENFTTTATAAVTTTLTVASTYFQQFTGTNTQTVVLPNATTLIVGQSFFITNRSTGYVTVNANGGGLVQSMAPGSQAIITVVTIGTSAGTWDSAYSVAGSIPFLLTNVIADSTTTGSAATLQAGDIVDGVVRLTNASLVSVSGIPAGTAGQHIVIENQTGNTFTINNNDAGATAANRIFTGTGGAIQMAANSSFEFIYDATVSRWMLVGGTGSGSGSGGSKNYLSVYTASTASGVPNTGNGNFELGSTSGWSLAHSALSSSAPTSAASAGSAFSSSSGGTAASGNLSLSVVSSAQLAGSYSGSLVSSAASTAGDLLISSAFFIDLEDKAKMMQVKFYYENVSGTFNNSGTSSNTFAVWIYDVTNGAWIQPQGVYNLVQGSGTGYCTATFQTTSNSTQYQLALININATAGAYTMYVDDLSVGPQIAPTGPAMTDWTAYTPTWTSSGTSPVIGNGTLQGFYKREGDSLIGQIHITAGSTTTFGSANSWYFGFPTGLSLDTTKIPSGDSAVGVAKGYNGTNNYSGVVDSDGTSNGVLIYTGTGSSTNGWSSTYPASWTTSSNLSLQFRVPIVGWSSNTASSADTDTRVVAARAFNTAGTTLTPTEAAIPFATPDYDTHGAFSGSTFTVPVSGKYRVSALLTLSAQTVTTSEQFYADLYKNGSFSQNMGAYIGGGNASIFSPRLTVTSMINCNAGDTLQIYAASNAFSPTLITTPGFNWATFERLSGPAVVQATESVNAFYSGAPATGTLTNSYNPVTFGTKVKDTHNAMSGSTYTVPVSGSYSIAALVSVNGTYALNNLTNLAIFKNATQIATEAIAAGGAENQINPLIAIAAYPFNAGDTITIKIFTQATGTSFSSNADQNYVSIARVGN